MSQLLDIIREVNSAAGSKAKGEVIKRNADNELLKQFLKAAKDPKLTYYIAKCPTPTTTGTHDFDGAVVEGLINALVKRKKTGNAAREWLQNLVNAVTPSGQELIKMIIEHDVGNGIGDSMILKAFPDLYFIPPYMRCSLIDADIEKKFNDEIDFYVQTKMDGSYITPVVHEDGRTEAFTRQGSQYPEWMVENITKGIPAGHVVMGEMLVYIDGKMLDRKTGNGIINSILSGEEIGIFNMDRYEFKMTAWDVLTCKEFFIDKESKTDYQDRLSFLEEVIIPSTPNIQLVDTWTVDSMEVANEIYSRHLADGKEGCIAKLKKGKWKNNTSTETVKMKLTFEFEMRVESLYEGTGKAAGMMGGASLKSKCGKLVSNIGSGFTDKQRAELWALRDTIAGEIWTIKANDIISNKTDNILSLNLPIFIERRFDKTEADTLEQIQAQKNAAIYGKSKLH